MDIDSTARQHSERDAAHCPTSGVADGCADTVADRGADGRADRVADRVADGVADNGLSGHDDL